jgi:hypothetical protein
MQIKNFLDLKKLIDNKLSVGKDKDRYPSSPDDFFDSNGKFIWPNFVGEIWKEDSELFITFDIDSPYKDNITIKISDIDWFMPIDYRDEQTKQKIYNQAKEKNFPLVENYLDFKDNILEYTLNKSSITNKIFFADQTTFLVDKYQLLMNFVYETHEIYPDKQEMEFTGQLYVYAQSIEVVDTNIEGLEYEKN